MSRSMFKDASNVSKTKYKHIKKARKLHSLKTLERLWKEISINIIGPLPKLDGKDAIVVIVD